jgi:hypothetical protein
MAIDKITLVATDSLFENTEISGTEAAKMPVGTTAQRANAQSGDIRFNSTLSLMEYYDGTGWKSIDAPPIVSSISPTVESDANANITISGSFFATGATVKFVGNDGTEYASPSVTRNSSSEIVATTPATALSVANEPYDVVVTNVSGLSGTLADALDAGGVPAFNESAGSLGTFYDINRTGISVDAGATDPDGDTITYSVSVGSLPSGLSLNTSTGEISGNADVVGSDTTTTFTISAATASDTSTRQFSITIAAPVVTSYTSVGSGSFSVPSGVTAVDVLVVAGGGGGGNGNGQAGGGAGGLIYRPAFPVTPGSPIPYSVGAGGTSGSQYDPGQAPNPSWDNANPGQNSTFGSLTAQGGGAGGTENEQTNSGLPGGSGGGSTRTGNPAGAPGTQPQQPGDSGTYGFGNPGGGDEDYPGIHGGGGGGGAGAAGTYSMNTSYAPGGDGKQYDISGSQVYYAGGGCGTAYNVNQGVPFNPGSGGLGGGGQGGQSSQQGHTGDNDGTANRGGGGGGGRGQFGSRSGYGGSGIVIVKY